MSLNQAQMVRDKLARRLREVGLEIHPEKTHIGTAKTTAAESALIGLKQVLNFWAMSSLSGLHRTGKLVSDLEDFYLRLAEID